MARLREYIRTRAVPVAIPLLLLLAFVATTVSGQVLLDPRTLTKYVDPLPIPPLMEQAAPNYYEIGMYEIQQQLHRDLSPATLWGYGTSQATASYPGRTILATRGTPIQVRWTNNLPTTHLLDYAIDPTLHMAMPSAGVPACVHLHGGEVEPGSDGGPDAWFTQGFAEKGPGWQYETYTYPNDQRSATLFYHDHALGITRLNLYTGLAGFYVITDPVNDPAGLPSGAHDIGLALQDRMLTADGQLWYPNVGDNPEHPIWVPEFFGDVMLVNGKAWPYLEVEPRKYRFRFLNGSNARFYAVNLEERISKSPGPAFHQIGSDGGLLAEPVLLNDPANPNSPRLILGTGERADVVVDFSAYPPGTEFILRNNARAPFPNGTAADPQTIGQVMLFRVVAPTGPDDSVLPAQLASVDRLANPTVTRTLTLNELMGMNGPLGAFLSGMMWDGTITETPRVGDTEIWEIANLTGDAHPIHLHLVQFQLLNRQKFNVKKYQAAWDAANPVWPAMMPTTPIPVGPYLKGKPIPPDANERGWKDTFRNNPGEITRYIVRFTPQDSDHFSFDPTQEPGYVWHCHIIEHEDNEMMRPYKLVTGEPEDPMMAARPETRASAAVESAITMLRSVAPNPSVNGGTIDFSLRNAGAVEIDLYTVDGRHVKQLAAGHYGAGRHTAAWQRTDKSGRALANGVYVVKFRGDGVQDSRKLIVLE
jgi:FtsP/CotA-like multicopper oxidase with cupredoxin domain